MFSWNWLLLCKSTFQNTGIEEQRWKLLKDFKVYFERLTSMELKEYLLQQYILSTFDLQLRQLKDNILLTMCLLSNKLTIQQPMENGCRKRWRKLSHYQASSLKVLKSFNIFVVNLRKYETNIWWYIIRTGTRSLIYWRK